jgi:1-deoxy-D-xylulose-5-phosphate synthase
MIRLGIPDRVVEHGEQLELHAECGYDPEGIVEAVKKLIARKQEKVMS